MKVCTRCKVRKRVSQFGKRSDKAGDGYRSHCNPCRRYEQVMYSYGLTPEQYDKMVADQNGCCAICGVSDPSLRVDHNHSCCPGKRSCGKCVRLLLCNDCNLFVGRMEFYPERTRKALAYIDHYKEG